MALDLTALERALGAATEAGAGSSAEQRAALSEARRAARKSHLPKVVAQAVEAADSERNIEAARLALRAVTEHPDVVQGYLAGAVALDRLGYLVEALAFFEQALSLSPNDSKICALLGSTALRCKQTHLAEKFFRLAMQMEPNEIAHLNNLAGALRDLGRFDDAIELLRERLYVAPQAATLWNTLGTVLQEKGDTENAITFLSEAARLDASVANVHHNLGCALSDLGRYDEAGDALDRALALARSPSERAEMRAARAYCRLGAGRLEEGWDDYEARFDPLTREPTFIRAPRPRWDTRADLKTSHILVMGEQGLGDEVGFLNAVPDVIAAAGAVTVACEKRLRPLVERSFPGARIVPHLTARDNGRIARLIAPEYWDGVDLWTPMGDLTKAYRPNVDAYPNTRGVLRCDPGRVAAIKAQLAPGVRVGILWKSLVMTGKRLRFFAPFANWAPLLRTPGALFYSLQYGETAEEETYAATRLGVSLHKIDGLDLKDDLDGVAAAGRALDLVIGPLNASTHLAAACGADVWLIERYPSWPTMGRAHSPWYPHARIFRTENGVWASLFETMSVALRERVATRADAA